MCKWFSKGNINLLEGFVCLDLPLGIVCSLFPFNFFRFLLLATESVAHGLTSYEDMLLFLCFCLH